MFTREFMFYCHAQERYAAAPTLIPAQSMRLAAATVALAVSIDSIITVQCASMTELDTDVRLGLLTKPVSYG